MWNGLNPFKIVPFRQHALKFLWSRRGHIARAATNVVDGKKTRGELEEFVLEFVDLPVLG